MTKARFFNNLRGVRGYDDKTHLLVLTVVPVKSISNESLFPEKIDAHVVQLCNSPSDTQQRWFLLFLAHEFSTTWAIKCLQKCHSKSKTGRLVVRTIQILDKILVYILLSISFLFHLEKQTLMEKHVVFILLAIFDTQWATPVLGCESNSDCDQGLYCCKTTKRCRLSCFQQVCSSKTDCGPPEERCIRGECVRVSPTNLKDDRSQVLVAVFAAIGGIIYSYASLWLPWFAVT